MILLNGRRKGQPEKNKVCIRHYFTPHNESVLLHADIYVESSQEWTTARFTCLPLHGCTRQITRGKNDDAVDTIHQIYMDPGVEVATVYVNLLDVEAILGISWESQQVESSKTLGDFVNGIN